MKLPLRRSAHWLGALALLGSTPLALHADIPWRRESVTLDVQQQPVAELLRTFAAQQGLVIDLSEAVRGTVSGEFTGLTPRQFLEAVTEASDLVWFWDGARLHVDAASELASRTLEAAELSPERASSALRALGFESGPPSRGTSVRGTEGVFTLVGGPRFLAVAEPVLRALAAQEQERRTEAAAALARDEAAARAAGAEMQVRVFRLRHATASDLTVRGSSSQTVVPGVARALQNLMGSPASSLSTGVLATDLRRQLPGLRGTGLAAVGQPTSPDPAPAAGNNRGPTRDGREPTLDSEQPLIQADPRLNAVIVRDTAARLPLYESLIAELDVASPVIEISAAVVDIDATNGRSLGVEFLSFGDGRSDVIGRVGFEADRAVNRDESGNTGVTPVFNDGVDLVRGPGFLSSVLVPVNGYELLTRIRALEEKGEAQLVTSPSVITLENIEANLRQEETVFVRVAGQEATDLFDVRAGVQLRVTPTLVRDGESITFRLVVDVQDGSFSDLVVDGVPSTRQSAINTQAIVPGDKTLLIGGYFVERSNQNARQVPILGDVPVLGRLFKRTENNRSRAQRFFFITPRLVDVQREAQLNRPSVALGESPLPAASTDPALVSQRAHELAGRGLPPVETAAVQR